MCKNKISLLHYLVSGCDCHIVCAATCFCCTQTRIRPSVPSLLTHRRGTVTRGREYPLPWSPLVSSQRFITNVKQVLMDPNEISHCSSSNIIHTTPLFSQQPGLTAECQQAKLVAARLVSFTFFFFIILFLTVLIWICVSFIIIENNDNLPASFSPRWAAS